jgi:hypothetical protein
MESKSKMQSKMNTSKSKSKSASKSVAKSTAKSAAKSAVKSATKGSSKNKSAPLTENTFIMQLHREPDELDASYRERIEFVRKLVAEKRVELTAKMVPFVSTMSFIHVYKKSGAYGYPPEIEIAYQKLIK